VDESWINELDFARRKWHNRDECNSLPRKNVSPRLSLLAAIDTDGRVFMALTTSNTTSEVICLFVSQLVELLEEENPGFRENTVLQFDGASYHRSSETRNYLANIGVKTIISGPYGYEIAPIEMFFAQLKSTNLNPGMLQTGKK
jgi:transposase